MSTDDPFRTPEQIAQRTGLSRKAIYRAIERGELPAYRLCGRLRIHPDDEHTWIENHRVAAAQPLELPAARPRPAPSQHSLRRLLQTGGDGPGLAGT
jgi:excisionase family DNA binding protein